MSVYSGTIVKKDRSNRRIPKNPMYSHVTGVVDTGASQSKVKPISTREYIKRKSEIFKRISGRQLHEILEETSIADDSIPEETSRSDYTSSYNPSENKGYLIVDLRSPEQFEACHITGALSFPAKLLRSDKTGPIYKYKNRMRDKGFYFVAYGNDERVASEAVTTLVQKGWENTLMLSKGLVNFSTHCPEYVVGDAPIMDTPRSVNSSRSGRSARSHGRAGGHRSSPGSRR